MKLFIMGKAPSPERCTNDYSLKLALRNLDNKKQDIVKCLLEEKVGAPFYRIGYEHLSVVINEGGGETFFYKDYAFVHFFPTESRFESQQLIIKQNYKII